MADLPRLNNIIRALEAGQHALTCFAPAHVDSAIAMSASKFDGCVFEITKDCMTEVFRRRPEFLDSISRIVAERRIENDRAQARAADPDKSKQAESLARQFKDRIRSFFRGIISG